jgi:myo-inositol 2-dehydrogenase/D-chiro-inositol 1-dehydrogenase
MRRIIKAQPVRVIASGAQDVEYKDEGYLQQAPGLLLHVRDVPGVSAAAAEKAAETAEKAEEPEKPDIIDNAFVIVEFENGVRAMLDLCMFAENSLYQEEVSLVGTLGKAEAFGSKHGEKEADEALVNFRLGLRPRSSSWSPSSHEPPPVDLLPPLTQQHVGVSDKKLMEAGAHEGSTFHEVRLFCEAIAADADVRAAALRQLVSVEDGRWAVAMGVAAQESIARGGMPVSILDPYA